MKKLNIMGSQVEIQEELTRQWYASSVPWGCKCGRCRNFISLARKKALPEPILKTLYTLEIPPENATYVCDLYPDKDGFRYQFSYRIAGKILKQNKTNDEAIPWFEGRCCHEPYPYGAPGFPEPHFDLEFWVTLPWILGEKP